jgi:hypothetical protein
MSGINGDVAIAILAVFLIGVAIGVVIIVSVASHREKSLTGPAPDATTRGARRVFGLGARDTRYIVSELDIPRPTPPGDAPSDNLVTPDGEWRAR